MTEVKNTATTSDAESVFPSEDVPAPVVFSQPVLLSDPLILNSPRVTIPKKNTTLKHNCPQPSEVPSVSKK